MQVSVDLCNAKDLTVHQKQRRKLTKMWNQTIPILGNGAKIWSGKNHAQKVSFWNH